MSKARSTGNLNNSILISDTGAITFVSGSTTLASLSTTGQLSGSTPALSASYAATASYAANFNVSGNISIGVTNPTYSLEVSGNLRVQGPPSTGIRVQSSGSFVMALDVNGGFVGGIGDYRWAATGNNYADFAIQANRNMGFFTNNSTTPSMYISSSGLVGIGTSTPSLTFHINKSGVSGAPASSSTSPTGYAVIGSTFNNNLYMGSYSTTPYGFWMQGQDATNLSQNYPIILNPNGGAVGIGTTSPSYILTVQSSNADTVSWRTPSYEVGRLGIDANNAHGWLALYSSGSYKVQITARPGGYTYFNAGNVGIGTDSPSTKLEVTGDTIISGSATAGGLIVQGVGNSNTGTSTIKVRNGQYGTQYNSILAAGEGSVGFLQLGNNGNNEIVGGATASGGYLRFWTNNTNYAPTAPNGNLALYLTSAGFATMPTNPAFSMYNNASVTGPNIVPAGGTIFNDGGYYNTSTYRFTAPVAGRYFFSFYCNVVANNTSPGQFYFRVNGSSRGAIAYTNEKTTNYYYLISFQQIIKLSANDIVDVYQSSTDRTDYGSTEWGNFSGYFLG